MNTGKKQAFYQILILGLLGVSLQAAASSLGLVSLSKLEASSGGRLGISAVDMNTNNRIQYRANERFPMGCTSKVIGVAAILKKSMSDPKLLQERIFYKKEDLTNWTPITEKHLTDGMTISELSAAAISYSDNTAMNLLAKKLGGPEALNNFARSTGDNEFNLTHWWPEEAMSSPFTKDDSTTPAAMEKSLQKIAVGNILGASQKEKLLTWLKNNTTGDKRIRAGVPKGWIVGDKTGTGFHYGTSNDIAIIWPPHCAPIIVTMYYSSNKKEAPKRDDILASATKILIKDFARKDSCVAADLVIPKEKTQVLQKIMIPKTYLEVGMGMAKFPPNTSKGRHFHTGVEVAYVLEGEVTLMIEGTLPKIIKAGDSFQIPAYAIHDTKAGPKGAKVLATWIGEKGKPISLPAK